MEWCAQASTSISDRKKLGRRNAEQQPPGRASGRDFFGRAGAIRKSGNRFSARSRLEQSDQFMMPLRMRRMICSGQARSIIGNGVKAVHATRPGASTFRQTDGLTSSSPRSATAFQARSRWRGRRSRTT
ncbi:hypothetical protein, partial [Bradyrhizobium sp.]|uniref:hypothetical protein n=1 Tax=Bradyrhizobium sp. TaxID=376 RepID=UPI0029133246